MAVVFCVECNHLISIHSTGCTRCGAPISKANPPPPAEPPPDRASPVAKAIATVGVAGLALLIALGSGKDKGGADLAGYGIPTVPETRQLASGVVRLSGCRHDWRRCSDNRDWAENADLAGPRGACLALVGAATGYGHIALDGAWSERRFTSYIRGTSIRRGVIVLVERAGLARDASGGWVRTPLHCTFDVGSWRARSVAPR